MSNESRSVIQALDRIRDALPSSGGIDFPQLTTGHVEHVLVFNVPNRIVLNDPGPNAFFSSHGFLTDLWQKPLSGSKVETSFPVDLSQFGALTQWPNPQPAPFDKPPVDNTNTADIGYSKQAYYFGDGSSLVTVGPSLPKITPLKAGGIQFWVGSTGVISQATGKYQAARGVSAYVGSAYFPKWPKSPQGQTEILTQGFDVLVAIVIKLVVKENLP